MTNKFQIERLTKEALKELGVSFRIFSIVNTAGVWEIWFSSKTPMEFVVRLRAQDAGNDESIRHKIKLELMKHASAPGAKSGGSDFKKGIILFSSVSRMVVSVSVKLCTPEVWRSKCSIVMLSPLGNPL